MSSDVASMAPGQLNPAQLQARMQMQARMRQRMAMQNGQMPVQMAGPPMSQGGGPAPAGQPAMPLQRFTGGPPNLQQAPRQQPATPSAMSQQDQVNIQHLARSMLNATPQETLTEIRANLANMQGITPAQRENFRNSGTDPLTTFFRAKAAKQYFQEKALQSGLNPGPSMQANPSPTSQAEKPMMQNAPAPQLPHAMPNSEYSNLMTFNQIQNQQATAFQSAKQGQQVVPANTGQQGVPRMIRNTPNPNDARQFISAPKHQEAFMRRQVMATAQQNQSPRQGPGFSNGSNAPGTPSRTTPATPRPPLQGQVGGLTQDQPQRNEMPHLNKPAPQNQPSQTQGNTTPAMQKQTRVDSRPPTGPQPRAQPQPGAPTQVSRMPTDAQIQQHMETLRPEKRQEFLQLLEVRRQKLALANSQVSGLPAQAPHTQANMNPNMPMPQQPSQTHSKMANIPAQRMQPQQITPERLRQLDALPYPQDILGSNIPLRPPKNVISWGDLKNWVSVTPGLPQDLASKLQQLQRLHVQWGGGHPNNLATTASARVSSAQAPTAPMATAPMTTAAVTPVPMVTAMSLQIPKLPAPSDQEVQKSREGFPKGLAHMSDEQIRAIIVLKKQCSWAQTEQKQPKPPHIQKQLQDFMQKVMARLSALQDQMNQSTNTSGATSQPPQIATARNQGPVSTHMKTPVQNPMHDKKGVKRQSTDDVAEVPNPKSTKQPVQKPSPATQGQVRGAISNPHTISRAQPDVAADPKEPKDASASTKRGLNGLNDPKIGQRYVELRKQVWISMPPGAPLTMNPHEKGMIEKSIMQRIDIVTKLPKLCMFLLQLTNDEERVKSALRTARVLIGQFREENPGHGFIDKLTINSTDCQKLLDNAVQLWTQFSQVPAQWKAGNPHAQPTTTAALSASNLQQQQVALHNERQADIKKQHNANRAPAAPTSAQPPFSFSPRPESPVWYGGPASVTQDTLRIPNKKRKPNTTAAPSPSLATKALPPFQKREMEKQKPKVAAPVFVCEFKGCESASFTSQATLQRHHIEVHAPTAIKEPLAFSLEKMRHALGLDEKGKTKAMNVDDPSKPDALSMKTSASSQGIGGANAKVEPSSATLSRAISQNSALSAGNGVETPKRDPSAKAPVINQPQGGVATSAPNPVKVTPAAIKNAWSGSAFSASAIHDAFSVLCEPLALTNHLWQRAGEDPDLTSDNFSSDNDTPGSKPTPSPRLDNVGGDLDIGFDSLESLGIDGADVKDLDEFMNWQPEGWQEYRDKFGKFPPVVLNEEQVDFDVAVMESLTGNELVSTEQFLAESGMSLEDVGLA